jgi:hypothetical protein
MMGISKHEAEKRIITMLNKVGQTDTLKQDKKP